MNQWGSIRRKQIARWQYLSGMKNVSYSLSKKYFWLVQYAAGYHPGPVAPPRTVGASLKSHLESLYITHQNFRTLIITENNLCTSLRGIRPIASAPWPLMHPTFSFNGWIYCGALPMDQTANHPNDKFRNLKTKLVYFQAKHFCESNGHRHLSQKILNAKEFNVKFLTLNRAR